MDKFQAPTTYEEAVERKENLLNKLNKYNEELLEGKEPSLTEEEYLLVQEEYEFLDCYVDVDAEFASSEEVTDKKFLDKIKTCKRVIKINLSAIFPEQENFYQETFNLFSNYIAQFWKNQITLVKLGKLFSKNI